MKPLELIRDITTNIKIQSSNFNVSHDNYKLANVPPELVKQMQKLPNSIQEKYMSSQLINLLYSIYHEGTPLKPKQSKLILDESLGLEQANFEVDWEFCTKLHYNNRGQGSFHPNFKVLRKGSDGNLSVKNLGVILSIDPKRHLRPEEQSVNVGDDVAITMPSSQLRLGYYVAIGNAIYPPGKLSILLYLNFSPEGAFSIINELTAKLNKLEVFFNFLVNYNPANYGGHYSGILRFYREEYTQVSQVIEKIYQDNQSYFKFSIPAFTKKLAPGLGLAEDPEKPFIFLENCSMNRCQIIANALLEAHYKHDESPSARMKYIIKHFENAGIDLERPYINPGSEDIYTPLDIINLSENLTV
ncbi:T3SS effector HopA1 family protein [Moorena producens]|uniref:T3SS effector HopA1 family protein n=1 Tax=Moorena producens TaxID=1155739 RepID=UPI003C765D7B